MVNNPIAHTSNDVDVLIVGAGPVGLFLANECARRGMRFRIIEAKASQSEHSKALAIFPRTLEIFDMAGVVSPFLEVANRVTSVAVIEKGHALAHMRFTPEESPYQFVAMVPQNVTENLLAEELRRKGGNIEYGTAFVEVERQIDGMRVTVEHGADTSSITATFVVGCDGAHSKVRKAMNLTLEGGEYDASFLLADVETNEALPADELQLCPSELGPVAIFPMSASRRRVVATIDQQEGDAPSLELVQRILKERAPEGIVARELHWSSYFRIHHRHAPRLRCGRMFIAGDAAHIHSPFGGQGMNTGLHDIWNLVWKLDLFLKGHGNEQLLESYTAERIPVIKNVIETTDFLTKALGTANKFAQAIRNVVIPVVSGLSPLHHAVVERLSELGINYAGSPIVDGSGQRYLDDSMRGGEGIRSRFLLITGDGQDAGDLDEDIVEVRASQDPGMKLVRPDGYVAYATQNTHASGALRSMRSLLELQTS